MLKNSSLQPGKWISNLGPDVIPLVTSIPASDARAVWATLSTHFRGSSIADTAANVSKLLLLRMNGTLMAHVDAINQLGNALSANITALEERNRVTRQAAAGGHIFTIQEIMQIAVLLSTLPAHFQTVVQSLWLMPNLNFGMAVTAITDFNNRWKGRVDQQGKARHAEALAATDESLLLSITIGKEAGRVPKIIQGVGLLHQPMWPRPSRSSPRNGSRPPLEASRATSEDLALSTWRSFQMTFRPCLRSHH